MCRTEERVLRGGVSGRFGDRMGGSGQGRVGVDVGQVVAELVVEDDRSRFP